MKSKKYCAILSGGSQRFFSVRYLFVKTLPAEGQKGHHTFQQALLDLRLLKQHLLVRSSYRNEAFVNSF